MSQKLDDIDISQLNEPNMFEDENVSLDSKSSITLFDLQLINKKIAIKFAEYKISNVSDKMLVSETTSISTEGILFSSPFNFRTGTLLRIWIEMPDYWARKARHVNYRHSAAPSYFQILARVISFEETGKRGNKFNLVCQNVNLEDVDKIVLNEYLGVK